MNKTRLENLSDGVFAIVITLLVFDLKVPEIKNQILSNHDLWNHLITNTTSTFLSYIVSFLIIVLYWLSHHTLFHFFTKTVNRTLVVYNALFLFLLSLVPFSARLISQFSDVQLSYVVYGINILLLGFTILGMQIYSIRSMQIENFNFRPSMLRKSRIRAAAPLICALVGIGVSFVNLRASLVVFVLPIFINLTPSLVDYIERLIRKFSSSSS